MAPARTKGEGIAPELLGVDRGAEHGVVRSESRVEPPEHRSRWLAIGGLLLAGIVGWSLLTGGDDEREAADPTPTTEPAPATTALPTTTEAPTSTTVETTTAVIGEGPLLAEETGLVLLLAGRELSMIDLDAGTLTSLDQTMDQVLGVVGPYALGMAWSDFDGPVIVDLRTGARTQAPPLDWPQPTSDLAPEGQAWFARYDSPTIAALRVDLASGLVVEERELPAEGIYGSSLRWMSPAGGGVYAVWGEDPPRRIAEGGIVVGLGERLLLQECDDALRCERRWFDAEAETDLDGLAVPDARSSCGGVGRDWLVCEHWGGPNDHQLEVYSVTFDVWTDLGPDIYSDDVALAPGGRWLARFGPGGGPPEGILITDLQRGETTTVEGVSTLDVYGGLVFGEAADLE